MGRGKFETADSWGNGSSVRAASITEDNGNEGVDELASSVEIPSVTSACRRARKLACRLRPDARPSGERPYTRLAARCLTRRREPPHSVHRAFTEAHPPQKTLISAQSAQRPNRPSTESQPSQGGLDAQSVRRHCAPRRAHGSMRSPRRLGCSDPSLHLLQPAHLTSSMPFMATTLQDDQGLESSSEFRGIRPAATPPDPSGDGAPSCPTRVSIR